MSVSETAGGLRHPDLALAVLFPDPPDDGRFLKQSAHDLPPFDPDTNQTDLYQDETNLGLNEKVMDLYEKDLVLLVIGESRDQRARFTMDEVSSKDQTDRFILSQVLDQEQKLR